MEKRDSLKTILVKTIADKYGITERSVYRVLAGDQENQAVFDDYMNLREEQEQRLAIYQNTPLLNAVKELVPFNR